jgi:hypothetical protein
MDMVCTCKHPAVGYTHDRQYRKRKSLQTAASAIMVEADADIRGLSPAGTFADFRLRRAITMRSAYVDAASITLLTLW